jgi:hypothetical protein
MRAQRFVGGVQRQRQAQRQLALRQPFDAGYPADGRDRGAPVGDPEVGQARAGGEHVLDVQHRLAHAHEHAVADRRRVRASRPAIVRAVAQALAVALGFFHAHEVQRLLEYLRGAEVAREAHLPRGAEGARQGAAGLRRDADRASPIAEAHQHRLQREVVSGGEQRLDGAVARLALLAQLEARERQLLSERLPQGARQVGHLLVAEGAPGRPRPHLAGAKARLAAVGERLLEQLEVHAAYGGSTCAWPSTSPTQVSPPGAPPRG